MRYYPPDVQTRSVIALFLFGLFGTSCDTEKRGPASELDRRLSPDGRVEAVLLRNEGGGATVGFSYNICIVPKGGSTASVFNDVLQFEDTSGIFMKWLAPRWLEIQVGKGRIFKFENYWYSKEVDNRGYIVEIRLMAPMNTRMLPG